MFFEYCCVRIRRNLKHAISVSRVSVGITVDAPVTAVSNKTNDIQCFKDIKRYRTIKNN